MYIYTYINIQIYIYIHPQNRVVSLPICCPGRENERRDEKGKGDQKRDAASKTYDTADAIDIQCGEDLYDALSCRLFFAKEPLIFGLFCEK